MRTSITYGSKAQKGRKVARIRHPDSCTYCHKNKKYFVDVKGFLLFPHDWDEDFAEGNAPGVGITGGLSDQQWKVIRFVRNNFERINRCPAIYVVCKRNCLGLGELHKLFPAGYLRGVCKLAGVTYREAYMQHLYVEDKGQCLDYWYDNRTYSADISGFLIDPSEWDENYALHKAYEMKFPEYLTDDHFRVIYYLRDRFLKQHQVPTIIETCKDLDIDLTELEKLFPVGYYRGAVKIAGLRVHRNRVLPGADRVQLNLGEKGEIMNPDEKYSVDINGFLLDDMQWDREFAESCAKLVEIDGGLTREHWDVINYIRATLAELGRCPLVFDTCRMCGLGRKDLKRLFPTGYLRGACRLAGITYREGYVSQASMPVTADDLNVISPNKVYTVDVRGFLIDPDDWDEYYAAFRAYDMKIPGGRLTNDHWRIVDYLRTSFARTKKVPTVYETCEANEIDLDELEKLFPDGYHRGVVKLAGLRVR